MDAKDEHHIDFLYRALNDAQETIRSTDAKAEIVIVLVGGVLAFIGAIHGRIDTLPLQALTTIGLVHVLIAAVCAIWALNPRVNPEEFIDVDGVKPPPLYYLHIKPAATGWRLFLPWRAGNYMELSAAEYLRHLEALDVDGLRRVLVYELLKVSFIREEKRVQVAWAVRFIPNSRWILRSPGGESVSAVTLRAIGRGARTPSLYCAVYPPSAAML